MPERTRVVQRLAEEELGRAIWYTYGETDLQAEATMAEMDKQFVAVIEEVNWSRVILEAKGRCLREGHVADYDIDEDVFPCGPCLQAALLVDKSWER